jgi:hypothetical protein
VLVHEDDLRRIDAAEVGAGRSYDCVESAVRLLDDVRSTLPCPFRVSRVRLDDDHGPVRELEQPGVDPREAELEDASRPVTEQLEDPRRRGCGESRREPLHDPRR